MKVLVDSSIWIEFFQTKASFSVQALESLIEERQVATCLPIKTEVLSGKMKPEIRTLVTQAFEAMDFVDLDWSSNETWNRLIEISLLAQRRKVAIPGIVDRMILACCLNSSIALWTLDRKLQKLSRALRQPLFYP